MILRRARLRLTLVFALAQLVLALVFAISVYSYVTLTFDFDGLTEGGVSLTAEAGFAALRAGLLMACAAVMVIAPGTSWLLAGLVLQPVRRSFEAQEHFVDDASHELRTPLTSIRAQLELAVHRERSADEYRGAIRRALDATSVLEQTLSDLLMLSQSDRETQATRSDVALHDVLRRCRELAPEIAHRIVDEVDERASVVGWPGLVDRLLLNLVANAARYSAAGSPIVVRAERRASGTALVISDSGIGMSAAEVAHATERFWRADASRASEGNGLGLAIVREIAAVHSAKLSIESAPGVGTSVSVLFPLSR